MISEPSKLSGPPGLNMSGIVDELIVCKLCKSSLCKQCNDCNSYYCDVCRESCDSCHDLICCKDYDSQEYVICSNIYCNKVYCNYTTCIRGKMIKCGYCSEIYCIDCSDDILFFCNSCDDYYCIECEDIFQCECDYISGNNHCGDCYYELMACECNKLYCLECSNDSIGCHCCGDTYCKSKDSICNDSYYKCECGETYCINCNDITKYTNCGCIYCSDCIDDHKNNIDITVNNLIKMYPGDCYFHALDKYKIDIIFKLPNNINKKLPIELIDMIIKETTKTTKKNSDLTIQADLIVQGNLTSVNSTIIEFDDIMLYDPNQYINIETYTFPIAESVVMSNSPIINGL